MSDDKTQEMPVMADAGDMPTETLHTVDAQSTYDQSQRSGRATQDDKPRVESAPAQGVPTYTASVAGANDGRTNRQTGDDILRPSGRSGFDHRARRVHVLHGGGDAALRHACANESLVVGRRSETVLRIPARRHRRAAYRRRRDLGDSQRGAFKPIQEWRRCGQRRSIRRSP